MSFEPLSQLTELESRLVERLENFIPSIGFGGIQIHPYHSSGYLLDVNLQYDFYESATPRCQVKADQELAFTVSIPAGKIIEKKDFSRFLGTQAVLCVRKWAQNEPGVLTIDNFLVTIDPVESPERGQLDEEGAYYFQVAILYKVKFDLQPLSLTRR